MSAHRYARRYTRAACARAARSARVSSADSKCAQRPERACYCGRDGHGGRSVAGVAACEHACAPALGRLRRSALDGARVVDRAMSVMVAQTVYVWGSRACTLHDNLVHAGCIRSRARKAHPCACPRSRRTLTPSWFARPHWSEHRCQRPQPRCGRRLVRGGHLTCYDLCTSRPRRHVARCRDRRWRYPRCGSLLRWTHPR
jgi:hypothetical protein